MQSRMVKERMWPRLLRASRCQRLTAIKGLDDAPDGEPRYVRSGEPVG